MYRGISIAHGIWTGFPTTLPEICPDNCQGDALAPRSHDHARLYLRLIRAARTRPRSPRRIQLQNMCSATNPHAVLYVDARTANLMAVCCMHLETTTNVNYEFNDRVKRECLVPAWTAITL